MTPWYLKPLDLQKTSKKPVNSGIAGSDNANNLSSVTSRRPSSTINLSETAADSSKSSSGKLLPLRPSMSQPHLPKVNNGKVTKSIKVYKIKEEGLGDLPQNGNHLVASPPKPFPRFPRRNVLTSPTPSGRMAPCPPRHLKL